MITVTFVDGSAKAINAKNIFHGNGFVYLNNAESTVAIINASLIKMILIHGTGSEEE